MIFRQSKAIILSQEGTTQGDPLEMLMYAVGTLPLIRRLKSDQYTQNWYADDSACCGKLRHVREWFDQLRQHGPKWGYFPEPEKSFLVVKPGLEEEAEAIFQDLNAGIVRAKRFLGGMIGPASNKKSYVKEKVEKWVGYVEKFTLAAKKSPQAAHAAFTKSLQCEWAFVQRAIQGCEEEYLPLRDAIRSQFMPALMGQEIHEDEYSLLELPVRLGGLAIQNPVDTQAPNFQTSKRAVELLAQSIISGAPLDYAEHWEHATQVLAEERKRRTELECQRSKEIIDSLQPNRKRVLQQIVDASASQWLTVLPKSADSFDLSVTQFQDALALRYGHTPKGLPECCDG